MSDMAKKQMAATELAANQPSTHYEHECAKVVMM